MSHFDELVNRMDIHFEEQLEKYKENQVLGDLNHSVISNEFEKEITIIEMQFG